MIFPTESDIGRQIVMVTEPFGNLVTGRLFSVKGDAVEMWLDNPSVIGPVIVWCPAEYLQWDYNFAKAPRFH